MINPRYDYTERLSTFYTKFGKRIYAFLILVISVLALFHVPWFNYLDELPKLVFGMLRILVYLFVWYLCIIVLFKKSINKWLTYRLTGLFVLFLGLCFLFGMIQVSISSHHEITYSFKEHFQTFWKNFKKEGFDPENAKNIPHTAWITDNSGGLIGIFYASLMGIFQEDAICYIIGYLLACLTIVLALSYLFTQNIIYLYFYLVKFLSFLFHSFRVYRKEKQIRHQAQLNNNPANYTSLIPLNQGINKAYETQEISKISGLPMWDSDHAVLRPDLNYYKNKKTQQANFAILKEAQKNKTNPFSFPSFSIPKKETKILEERLNELDNQSLIRPYNMSQKVDLELEKEKIAKSKALEVQKTTIKSEDIENFELENNQFQSINTPTQQEFKDEQLSPKPLENQSILNEISQSSAKKGFVKPVTAKIDLSESQIKFAEDLNYDSGYIFPSMSLLKDAPVFSKQIELNTYIENLKQKIVNFYQSFDIACRVVNVNIGPSVLEIELQASENTRVNRFTNLSEDLKLNLASKEINIQAPIPGKSTIGIEIENPFKKPVSFKDLFLNLKPDKPNITVVLGKNMIGEYQTLKINKTPHLLIAGATGSGKSVCINAIIISILMLYAPWECRLLLVDPKKVELTPYENLPHLISPIITDAKKAALALKEITKEMDERYSLFQATGVKNIEAFNQKLEPKKRLPYIVAIIDELADLMIISKKTVEEEIQRITQLARAAGIHLIVATQRPTVNVVTGLIKANIPSRIAFAMKSAIDSRTILDEQGADKLLGKGDMLFQDYGAPHIVRLQGAYLSDEEINAITNFLRSKYPTYYEARYDFDRKPANSYETDANSEQDEIYEQVKNFVIDSQKASASLIQRKFSLGYNRAARIMDMLENEGIISSANPNSTKPREVLVKKN